MLSPRSPNVRLGGTRGRQKMPRPGPWSRRLSRTPHLDCEDLRPPTWPNPRAVACAEGDLLAQPVPLPTSLARVRVPIQVLRRLVSCLQRTVRTPEARCPPARPPGDRPTRRSAGLKGARPHRCGPADEPALRIGQNGPISFPATASVRLPSAPKLRPFRSLTTFSKLHTGSSPALRLKMERTLEEILAGSIPHFPPRTSAARQRE